MITQKRQIVNQFTKVQCYGCGWKGELHQAKKAVWLNPINPTPSNVGGDGTTYRCPLCRQLIFYTRYDDQRKIIAPQGHQYREVI